MAMKKLFSIESQLHGRGPVLFKWQPQGNFLATAGVNGVLIVVRMPSCAEALCVVWSAR